MKLTGKILICLAGGLAFATGLRADDVLLPGNPYAPVVVRNIFGLNPPPPIDPNATTAEPPVKITPNGIMSIFGQLQVLFKVAGKPAGKDAYILTEGQRQDDIEVTKIDEKNGIVTFNNHGIVQALPLVPAAPSSTPASVLGNPTVPGSAPIRYPSANGFNNRFGNRSGNVPTRSSSFIQQPENNLTPEESTVAIEVNRELTKQQVMEGSMPPLPPTEATPSDATGPGGGPLVAPSPGSPP